MAAVSVVAKSFSDRQFVTDIVYLAASRPTVGWCIIDLSTNRKSL